MNSVQKLLPKITLIAAFFVLLAACSESNTSSSESAQASSESKQTGGSAYEPTRNSAGQPNMQGIWDFRTLTPLERPGGLADDKAVYTSEEAEAFRQEAVQKNDFDKQRDVPATFDVEGAYNTFWWDFGTEANEDRRTSLIVDPTNGRLPDLTPEAMAAMKEGASRVAPVHELASLGLPGFRPEGPESLGLSERCLVGFNAGPPLTPSAYNNNIRIVQTPTHVVLVTEMVHNARIIPIDGRPDLPEELSEWSGDARGHWEGNTLVIETTHFTDKTPSFQLPFSLDKPGVSGAVGIGKNLRLTERLTLMSDSRLLYEYTLNDPVTFTRPFTVAISMKASEEQLYEYACHEGNYAMAGMLKGARQLEKEAMAAH